MFGSKSLEILKTCDVRLQEICNAAIQIMDFSIIAGTRNKADQDKAYAEGHSCAKWGQSLHDCLPSKAVDIIPYPFVQADWKDVARFKALADVMLKVAAEKKIKIRWGGTFTHLVDMPHFEIVEDSN